MPPIIVLFVLVLVPVLLLRLFDGQKEFNPRIILFSTFRWPTTLRFYQHFHDARHGTTRLLAKLENELRNWLNKPINLEQFHPRRSA